MQYDKGFTNKPGRKVTTSSPRDVQLRHTQTGDNSQLIEQLKKQLEDLKVYFTTGTGGITPEQLDDEIRTSVKNAIKETRAHYEQLLDAAKKREELLHAKMDILESRTVKLAEQCRLESEQNLTNKTNELEKKYNKQISELSDKLKLTQEKLVEKESEISNFRFDREDTIKKMLEEHNRRLEELSRTISIEKLGIDDPNRPRMDDVFVDPLDKNSGEEYETHIELDDVTSKRKEDMGSKVNKLKSLMGTFADKEENT